MSDDKQATVDERLKAATEVLEQYTKSLGLDAIKYNNEVEKILPLTSTELRNLDEQDSLIYGYILENYAAFLAKEQNYQSARLMWATHNLNVTVGKVYNNYGNDYTKHEVRQMLIINDNEYASILSKIALQASSRLEQLKSISFNVSKMAEFLKSLSRSKKYE